MIMCHMVADTLAELHTMAEKLGVRQWFQESPAHPHYDISLSKRKEAVALGAIEITQREVITRVLLPWRERGKP
jgi:hypothetical protein